MTGSRINSGQSGIVSGNGIDGSRAYRVVGTSTVQSSSFTLTQNVAVKERTIYQVSSYFRQQSAGTCTISIVVGGMHTAGPLSPTTSFLQLQGQWTSGEGQTSVTLVLQGTCNQGGATRALFVDNVSMMEVVA